MLSLLSSLQPPPTAEELALKEQVTQALVRQGVLGKLKAELRAAVFLVMHERDGFVDAAKAEKASTRRPSDFSADTRATAMALMLECLRFFKWEHTLRVLQAEANAEEDEQDAAMAKEKLGLASGGDMDMPTLFQLIEARMRSDMEEAPTKQPELEEEREQEEEALTKPSKQEETEEEDADSGEMEESMAEELPSDLELDESIAAEREQDEQSDDEDVAALASPLPTRDNEAAERQEEEDDEDVAALASPLPTRNNEAAERQEEEDDDAVALAAPPPAPSKLPALPPLVGVPNDGLAVAGDDDFDAETEAERLRSLDAALKAMEAEDDTGTLQQLKASLQRELREHDSLASREEEAQHASRDDEDGDGYGSSDFEEDEEIHSEISEEMESMPELSDKEDDSQDDAPPPRVLQTDTRVDSEDALNSYDYVEAVDKSDW